MVDESRRIERLRAVAAASNLRSPLARWLSTNQAEFEKLLQDYRPRWEALIEQFAVDGLLKLPAEFNSDDPTIRSVSRRRVVKAAMRTWERVKTQAKKSPALPPAGQQLAPMEPPSRSRSVAAQPAQQTNPTTNSDILAMLSPGRKLPDPL